MGKMSEQDFLTLAARVFGVSPSTISPATRRGDIPEWDSVNHLRLVMAAEETFGVAYTLEEIPSLATLGDFIR